MENDVPWLCDMIEDEELQVLFSGQSGRATAWRPLPGGASGRKTRLLERRLIDLVETSLDYRNDGSEATLWATVVLGESAFFRSRWERLTRCLATDDDEMLQEVAGIAVLRIGPARFGMDHGGRRG